MGMGDDYAAVPIGDADIAHGILCAILVANGGYIDLEAHQFAPDAMGNAAGELYHVGIEGLPQGGFRVSVIPRR